MMWHGGLVHIWRIARNLTRTGKIEKGPWANGVHSPNNALPPSKQDTHALAMHEGLPLRPHVAFTGNKSVPSKNENWSQKCFAIHPRTRVLKVLTNLHRVVRTTTSSHKLSSTGDRMLSEVRGDPGSVTNCCPQPHAVPSDMPRILLT